MDVPSVIELSKTPPRMSAEKKSAHWFCVSPSGRISHVVDDQELVKLDVKALD